MIAQPKVSVITASLNCADGLRECLESVARQQGVTLEHLVIDGGSTDGTIALLEQWSPRLAFWCSEPDSGIAEAMNKGIAQAAGEWLLFLQGDDYFADPLALRDAIATCAPLDDICAFPVRFGSLARSVVLQPRGNGIWLNFKNGFNHQATLIRRTLFNRIGNYDTRFKIAIDYEFFLRAARKGAQVSRHRAPVLSLMGDAGVSSRRDWPGLSRRFAEERRIHALHRPPGTAPFYAAFWALYLSYRRGLDVLGRVGLHLPLRNPTPASGTARLSKKPPGPRKTH